MKSKQLVEYCCTGSDELGLAAHAHDVSCLRVGECAVDLSNPDHVLQIEGQLIPGRMCGSAFLGFPRDLLMRASRVHKAKPEPPIANPKPAKSSSMRCELLRMLSPVVVMFPLFGQLTTTRGVLQNEVSLRMGSTCFGRTSEVL